jgi:hypothetical protein
LFCLLSWDLPNHDATCLCWCYLLLTLVLLPFLCSCYYSFRIGITALLVLFYYSSCMVLLLFPHGVTTLLAWCCYFFHASVVHSSCVATIAFYCTIVPCSSHVGVVVLLALILHHLFTLVLLLFSYAQIPTSPTLVVFITLILLILP